MRYLIVSLVLVGFGCIDSVSVIPSESTPTPLLLKEGLGVVTSDQTLPLDGQLTYKGFGEYVEDRFTGYHVGIDLEAPADTPVYAIADGKVTYATITSGYGGVMVVRHEFNGRIISAIYGHLDPESMKSVGDSVMKEEQIAVLGEKGIETDGEREHLHFAMYEGDGVRVNGYETNASGVANWLNPVDELGEAFIESGRLASTLEYAQGEGLFSIDFELRDGWDIEYIPSIQSLSLYTHEGSGTARQRSQIFIRYFDASSFLTLSTVTIYSIEDLTIGTGDYIARRYDIQKNAGVADFADQPFWRNERHIVTDFRATEGLTRYYVVAANPELDPKVYEEFLASLTIR